VFSECWCLINDVWACRLHNISIQKIASGLLMAHGNSWEFVCRREAQLAVGRTWHKERRLKGMPGMSPEGLTRLSRA